MLSGYSTNAMQLHWYCCSHLDLTIEWLLWRIFGTMLLFLSKLCSFSKRLVWGTGGRFMTTWDLGWGTNTFTHINKKQNTLNHKNLFHQTSFFLLECPLPLWERAIRRNLVTFEKLLCQYWPFCPTINSISLWPFFQLTNNVVFWNLQTNRNNLKMFNFPL